RLTGPRTRRPGLPACRRLVGRAGDEPTPRVPRRRAPGGRRTADASRRRPRRVGGRGPLAPPAPPRAASARGHHERHTRPPRPDAQAPLAGGSVRPLPHEPRDASTRPPRPRRLATEIPPTRYPRTVA